MNLHTQGWGFATTFPLPRLSRGVTLVSLLSRTQKPASHPGYLGFHCFRILDENVTTITALHPTWCMSRNKLWMKIMLMSFVAPMLIKTNNTFNFLILIVVISLAYYGVKGGIFTIIGGGVDRVWDRRYVY